MGPPARASGPTWPMQAPVLTPLKRPSVMTATCLPQERFFSAPVTWSVSSMPLPSGPAQITTMISPGRTSPFSDRLDAGPLADEDAGRTGLAVDAVRIHQRWVDGRALDHRALRGEVALAAA